MRARFDDLRQTEAAECGLVALAIASRMLGADLSMADIRHRHPISSRGLTLKDLGEIAGTMDMTSRAIRCDIDDVPAISCPAILHWGLNHFVVLVSASKRGAKIVDPAGGTRTVTTIELDRYFTGVALELSATPSFVRRTERSPLKLSSLFRWTPELQGGLGQAFVLSLLLQAYIIASPFYMQLAIDEGALKGDGALLATLAWGFALFAAFNAVAEALRAVALQRVSALLGWDMTRRLFHHMVRLPLPWFQRRRLADALTRFDSLTPVKNLISNGLVAAVIDGMLSVVTLVMMFVFSPRLAILAVLALAVATAIRLASIPYTMKLGAASLAASIAEQGKRIETLRAMQTIKVMAAENERESDWGNRFAETIRTQQTAAFASIGVTTAQKFIDAIALVFLVYVGVLEITKGSATIGTFYAFLAYRTQFASRVQSLIDQVTNARLLDMHTQRLADIALHPAEQGMDIVPSDTAVVGMVELENVSFAYAAHERPVFRNVSIKISPGEFVAIVGPSGGGKSTLLKVLSGLYPASSGEVRIDGVPLKNWGTKAVRRALGVVMQDDELLSGSICQNVTFFSDHPDIARVWKCLAAASLESEVKLMPMQIDTLIGDMGSSLSGGQKQRVLLARALYREPRILILDEATSHLDIGREASINTALRDLAITRIIVAHRPETIASADRIIILDGGGVVADRVRPPREVSVDGPDPRLEPTSLDRGV